MARQWQQLSLEDSKRHPLYGIKNWLAIFAFGILIAPLRTIGEFSNAAHKSGLTLSQLLSADISTGAFIKASLAFNVAIAMLLLWLLFSKHRHFRVTSISLLVLYWPAYFVVAFITGGTQFPGLVGALTLQFLSSLLLIAIWVAYLQRSRRVRVTFDNCVVVEKIKASALHNKRMPLGTTQTTTAGNDAYAEALAEIEEGRLNKGVWARSFAESGGDESKAKALYIKARAESIKGAEVWEDTKPPEADDAGIKAAGEGGRSELGSYGPVSTPKWPVQILCGIAIVGVLGAFASQAYQSYTKREASPIAFGENDTIVEVPSASRPGGSNSPHFGENDTVVSTPVKDLFGGTPVNTPVQTLPEKASERDSYVQKVMVVQDAVRLGGISSINSSTSYNPPKNLIQWTGNEAWVLEGSQTWWRSNNIDFSIHLKNTSPNELAALGVDFSEQDCGNNHGIKRFFVTFAQPIPAGSQAVVKFKPEFPVSETLRNCLVISSAWR